MPKERSRWLQFTDLFVDLFGGHYSQEPASKPGKKGPCFKRLLWVFWGAGAVYTYLHSLLYVTSKPLNNGQVSTKTCCISVPLPGSGAKQGGRGTITITLMRHRLTGIIWLGAKSARRRGKRLEPLISPLKLFFVPWNFELESQLTAESPWKTCV